MKLDIGLRFPGTCEEAFQFYQSVFGGELFMLQRFKEMREHGYKIEKRDENKVAFVGLKVNDDFILGGDDYTKTFNKDFVQGNNVSLNVSVASKEEADRIYHTLSTGGVITGPIADVYWGEYCGYFTDKYGILWGISYRYPKTR
jgi:PhnB protein